MVIAFTGACEYLEVAEATEDDVFVKRKTAHHKTSMFARMFADKLKEDND